MRTRLFIISFFLLPLLAVSQPGCPEMYTMRVIAESGLNMRKEPSLSSEKVITVPYKAKLKACSNTSGKLTISKITGYWRRCIYRGEVGYMFDGFMEMVDVPTAEKESPVTTTAEPPTKKQVEPEKQEEQIKTASKPAPAEIVVPGNFQFLTETYNYCGDVKEIDPGLIWYAFYPPGENETDIRIKKVEIEVLLSKARTSDNLEFDIKTDQPERSIFLIGANRQLDLSKVDTEDQSDLLRYSSGKVFPGQEISLGKEQGSHKLSALGSVKTAGDCPTLEGYKLSIRKDKEQDLTSLLPKGACGMPEIFWFGDFTGDDVPEIIFVSVYKDRNVFSLLISEGATGNQILRKQTDWTIKKCN